MVTRVADGDTIEVSGPEQTVRLVGINAPELGECFGDESRANLEGRLLDREVTLQTAGTDQFDRLLAQVFVGETNVNAEVVGLGLAIATSPENDSPAAEATLAAEADAYESLRGLWSPNACGTTGPIPDLAFDASASQVNPPGPDDAELSTEYVVLVNQGIEPIDLSGWTLRDESSRHRYAFPASSSLDPGQTRVVTSADPGWNPGGSPVWNNDGDMALLLDPNGTVVARWRY